MARKRMFDLEIINQDNFFDLPMEAKALYFLLGMEADDEGFVSPKKILRLYGGTEDSLKILAIKKFIIPFKTGVIVITDWKRNNYLDKNRIKETIYQREKQQLEYDEITEKYVLKSECLTDVKQMLNQNRIEEYSIEENRIENNRADKVLHCNTSVTKCNMDKETDLKEKFEELWKIYPNKKGKTNAYKSFKKAIKENISIEEIKQGLENYIRYIEIEKVEQKYIKHGSTWFNQQCWNDDYTIKRKLTTKDIADKIDFSDVL